MNRFLIILLFGDKSSLEDWVVTHPNFKPTQKAAFSLDATTWVAKGLEALEKICGKVGWEAQVDVWHDGSEEEAQNAHFVLTDLIIDDYKLKAFQLDLSVKEDESLPLMEYQFSWESHSRGVLRHRGLTPDFMWSTLSQAVGNQKYGYLNVSVTLDREVAKEDHEFFEKNFSLVHRTITAAPAPAPAPTPTPTPTATLAPTPKVASIYVAQDDDDVMLGIFEGYGLGELDELEGIFPLTEDTYGCFLCDGTREIGKAWNEIRRAHGYKEVHFFLSSNSEDIADEIKTIALVGKSLNFKVKMVAPAAEPLAPVAKEQVVLIPTAPKSFIKEMAQLGIEPPAQYNYIPKPEWEQAWEVVANPFFDMDDSGAILVFAPCLDVDEEDKWVTNPELLNLDELFVLLEEQLGVDMSKVELINFPV